MGSVFWEWWDMSLGHWRDVFNAGFYLDINNDGVRDLIASPNADAKIENYEVMWYYENKGTDDNPDFEVRTKIRAIDPDVLIDGQLKPLSQIHSDFGQFRHEYITGKSNIWKMSVKRIDS